MKRFIGLDAEWDCNGIRFRAIGARNQHRVRASAENAHRMHGRSSLQWRAGQASLELEAAFISSAVARTALRIFW